MAGHLVDKTSEPGSHGSEEQAFESFLRERGLKFTRPRRLLLRKIFAMHDHFTADQLLDRLRRDRIRASKATVYRTLSVLMESDLLISHDFGEGSLYYEHAFGHTHHDHLFCVHCKSIVEFRHERIEDLQERIAREAGFKVIRHSLKLYGLCRSCAAEPGLLARHSGGPAAARPGAGGARKSDATTG